MQLYSHHDGAVSLIFGRSGVIGLTRQTRAQFIGLKRLDHVIIGAQLQADEPVGLLDAGSEHDDWRLVLAADGALAGHFLGLDCPCFRSRPLALGQRVQGDLETARAAFVARQPLGRLGTPEEIAALDVYLGSDASSFTTGQIHVIDGGWAN